MKVTGQDIERFDQVFLACHGDQALKLLADPSPTEEQVLGTFHYQPNEAILHTDETLLPTRRRAWAAWNYRVDASNKIIKRIQYRHPVFTAESIEAQKRHAAINGAHRTYYCGAYWRNGFHEDGVVSALAALEHFEERRKDEERNFLRAS